MADDVELEIWEELRDPFLIQWRKHRIEMNAHVEACIQSLNECRTALWQADKVLERANRCLIE
jgi:hypothetical protein